jgi:hypothetical protein
MLRRKALAAVRAVTSGIFSRTSRAMVCIIRLHHNNSQRTFVLAGTIPCY